MSDAPGPDKKPYTVGYGKPPERTQFKKGQSGNPAGRPAGKLNLQTVLEKALQETVTVNEGGRRLKRSKIEVSVTQIVNKAASGDIRAFETLLKLLPILDSQMAEVITPDQVADRALARKLAERFATLKLAGASGENKDGD